MDDRCPRAPRAATATTRACSPRRCWRARRLANCRSGAPSRERDLLECTSPVARINCGTLAALLHERARFALRLPAPGRPLMHVQSLRLAVRRPGRAASGACGDRIRRASHGAAPRRRGTAAWPSCRGQHRGGDRGLAAAAARPDRAVTGMELARPIAMRCFSLAPGLPENDLERRDASRRDAGDGDQRADRQGETAGQTLADRAAQGRDAAEAHQHRAGQLVAQVGQRREALPAEGPRRQRMHGGAGDHAEHARDAERQRAARRRSTSSAVPADRPGPDEAERFERARIGGEVDGLQRVGVLAVAQVARDVPAGGDQQRPSPRRRQPGPCCRETAGP